MLKCFSRLHGLAMAAAAIAAQEAQTTTVINALNELEDAVRKVRNARYYALNARGRFDSSCITGDRIMISYYVFCSVSENIDENIISLILTWLSKIFRTSH